MENNKKDLDALRLEIDAADRELIKNFEKRMGCAARIAEYKRCCGKAVFDPVREREKLKAVANEADDGMKSYVKSMYSLLFELSRDYQNKLIGHSSELYEKISHAIEETPRLFPTEARVACQGTEGAYSMAAAKKLFRDPDIVYVKTFADVVRAVRSGYVKYGMLPIENSTAGAVNGVYELLAESGVYAVRGVKYKVEHSLLANRGAALSDIKEVISHEQAINQSRDFLDNLSRENGGIKITYAENTALAARAVAESGRLDLASISSYGCAEINSLSVLKRDIQTTDNNYTRFLCVSRDIEIYPGADKTSVMLVTGNKPGALYKVLSRFNALGINMTNLVSRPITGRDFEFRFFIDFETSVYSEDFASLINTVEDVCEEFCYLGSYVEK